METANESASVSPELLARARAAVKEHYADCFWFRHPEAEIETREDVRLVVRRLRENGDQAAWHLAQELQRCL